MAPRSPKDTSKSPAKAAGKAKAAPRAAARAAKAAPQADAALPATDAVATLRLKDLVDGVAAATGGKKPEVKKTVEATLAALSAALGEGAMLVLPPLGKLRVVKTTPAALTLKLRLVGSASKETGAKTGALALADPDQDS